MASSQAGAYSVEEALHATSCIAGSSFGFWTARRDKFEAGRRQGLRGDGSSKVDDEVGFSNLHSRSVSIALGERVPHMCVTQSSIWQLSEDAH